MKSKSAQQWETEVETDLGRASVVITYNFDAGEPRVDYYPDGSGSPGQEPSVSISKINMEIIHAEVDVLNDIKREILDEILNDELDGEFNGF
jgi:hypothetical protein